MNHASCKGRALALILATLAAAAPATAGAADPPALVNGIRVDGAELGEWTHDWEAATAAAKASGKPVFANFTGSDWCGWCKLLKRRVFTQPEWRAWAAANVWLVHLDFPNDRELVPEKYRERNLELARRYRVSGYPTCLLLDPATLEPVGRFGASRDVDAAGFAAQVASAIPGAERTPDPTAAPSAPAPRPVRPLPPRGTGEPVFDIKHGVLRGMQANGAEIVVVPESVKRVEYGSFLGAGGVVAVRLPEGLEAIGARAFENLPSLERVSVPASVAAIGAGAFGWCPRLSELEIASGSRFAFRNGILFDTTDKAVLFAIPRIRQAEIPEDAREIGKEAFKACSELEEISVPEGVAAIGQSAFLQCAKLSRVRLPASLETIGDSAFADCPSLETIEMPAGGRCSVAGNFLLADGGKTLLRGFGRMEEVRIPDGIERIAPNAFSGNRFLRRAFVPDAVSDIGYSAFSRCPELEELRLPRKADKCGSEIAAHCPKLRELAMPEGVGELRFTYWGCKSLSSLHIPSSVKTVGQQAVQGCDGLVEIAFPEGIAAFRGNGIVSDCANLARIVLPSTVETIEGWNVFGRNPKLESIEVSPDNPFFRSVDGVLFDKNATRLVQCPGAKSGVYEIPATVSEIAPLAFAGCRNLTEIRIPASVKTIGYRAFGDCPARTNRVSAADAPAGAVDAAADGGAGEEDDAPALPIGSFPVDGVVAGFTFNSEDKADDFAKPGRAFKTVDGRPVDAFLEDGVLRMDGEYRYGEMPQLVVPELRYDRFTVAMNFRPQAEPGRSTPLLSFGGGWRWFHVLLRGDGTPVVSFRGLAKGEISFPLGEQYRPGKWNWLAAAFDAAERRLSVVLNGRRLPGIALPDDFAFRFDRDDRAQSRTVQFANLNNGTAYKGEIAGFLLFDRAFTDAELDAIAVAPVVPSAPWTFVPDKEEGALYWNGTISNGSVTLDARLAGGTAAVSFPEKLSVPGGILDLSTPIVDGNGAEVPLVGIGGDSDERHIGFGGVQRTASEVRLPPTVRYLGPGAFERFASLARFDCPASVRRIGSAAFSGCRSLRFFRVGPLVEAFSDDRVFMGCEALETIETDPANRFFRTVDGALLSADGRRLVAFPPGRKGAFAVPPGVEEIPARAFLGCKELTAVSIPASVGRIGPYAFAGCPALERIDFENRAFVLDDRVFGSDAGKPDFRRPATNLENE